MKRKSYAFLVAALCLFLPSLLVAQVNQEDFQETVDRAEFGAGQQRGFFNPLTALQFTTKDTEKRIEGNIAGDFHLSDDKEHRLQLNLGVSTPLSKDGSETRPLDLDGLAQSSKLSFGLQFSFWNPTTPDDATLDDILTFFQGKTTQYQAAGDLKKDEVIMTRSQLSKEDQMTFDNRFDGQVDFGNPGLLGMNISWLRKDFTYVVDPVNFTEMDTSHSNIELNVFGGLFTKNGGLFRFGLAYEADFTGGTSQTFLVPFDSTGTLVQKDYVMTAPIGATGTKFRIDYVGYVLGNSLGINPQIEYNLKAEALSFELPIFFLQQQQSDKSMRLNGGVFLGWQSSTDNINFEKKAFSAGVFLGTNFGKLF